MDDQAALLAVAIGNTRARLGLFRGRELAGSGAVLSADPAAAATLAEELVKDEAGVTIVMSDVNPRAADAIAARLEAALGGEVYRIGRDVAMPLRHALDDASTLGQDRALCAIGASVRAEQAVAVIDAGTAITVDFVDGEGVFQGGVIAPGLGMMLRALHEQTAALPKASFEPPDPARGPFGRDTRHAMMLGVVNAARGLVRHTIERFAEAYEAYPQIVATGGDAGVLFDGDGLVEHIVPDLQLLGIVECVRAAGEGA
jgi:type III pantothenate kinase